LTAHNKFPPAWKNYPLNEDRSDLKPKFAIPWFFHYDAFHDLKLAYMLGVGVDKDQMTNLIVDFVNMFIISMYIFTFRNPILVKTVSKVFWLFPSPDNANQWSRLEPKVQSWVKWLHSPTKLTDEENYVKGTSNY